MGGEGLLEEARCALSSRECWMWVKDVSREGYCSQGTSK